MKSSTKKFPDVSHFFSAPHETPNIDDGATKRCVDEVTDWETS